MADLRKITHASMRALVSSYGCFDAVAEVINARWGGGCSKGTISKKMSSVLDWTVAEVIALEDAAGRWPVTRVMARRLGGGAGQVCDSLVAQTGEIARECGEAVSAILSAEQSSCADERAQAVVEINEAIVAMESAREKLKQPYAVNLADSAVPFRGPVK